MMEITETLQVSRRGFNNIAGRQIKHTINFGSILVTKPQLLADQIL